MRLIFFGTPLFAVASLEALLAHGHDVAVVVTQPDRPRGRGQRLLPTPVKERALALHVPVWQPASIRRAEFLDEVGKVGADLGVVVAYGKILPDELLRLPRLGMINVHGSLLPKYRGAAPIHRAVMDGMTETGITIMQVVRELDAGPMLAVERCAISPVETSEELETRLAVMGAALLATVVDALASGPVEAIPQDEREATYAPRLTKDESAIDWTVSARAIHNRVRGLTPWPLAHSFVRGQRLVLHRTLPLGGVGDVADVGGAAAPGEIIEADPARIVVECGNASRLAILEVQPAGRRRMSVRDFLSGHPVVAGERFSPSP